ncbi:mitochondrial ornithine transporter-like protein [Leptotrombidium deliense]|uniref:Mitochondrial ornithine transporter-like protein n=1 Tax=Leptotrombidium deliense TaxID=299467 RepID=A0A443S373_9ACAR|nr:mitochondrial ornithine transporter-like protein [Leptotrombidium deliense]
MVNYLCTVNRPSDEENRPFILGVIDFTAGSIAAVVNAMVGLPLDTIKVKMQTFPLLYGGAWSCFKDTVRKYGVKGLYAGAVPCIVAEVSEKSVLFCAHGYCQYAICRISGNTEEPTVLENSLAGFCAALFSSFTLCPTEMIKCKLQALRDLGHPTDILIVFFDRKPYKITKDIIATHGIRGLFNGLTPTMMREMPGYFFYFGGYQMTKSFLTNNDPNDKASWKTAVAGGVGGVALWASIYPVDLVKTRIQISETTDSMRYVMMMIIKNEGFFALYRGVWPSIFRTFPATAALFVVYENSVEYMIKAAESLGLLSC